MELLPSPSVPLIDPLVPDGPVEEIPPSEADADGLPCPPPGAVDADDSESKLFCGPAAPAGLSISLELNEDDPSPRDSVDRLSGNAELLDG